MLFPICRVALNTAMKNHSEAQTAIRIASTERGRWERALATARANGDQQGIVLAEDQIKSWNEENKTRGLEQATDQLEAARSERDRAKTAEAKAWTSYRDCVKKCSGDVERPDPWIGTWHYQGETTWSENGGIGEKNDYSIVIRREGNKLLLGDPPKFTWTVDGSRATGRWEFGTTEVQLSSDGRTFSGTFTGKNSETTWGGKLVGTKVDDH